MTTRVEIPAKEKSATLLLASRLMHLAKGFFFTLEISSPCNVFTIPHTSPDCLAKLGCLDGIPTDYCGDVTDVHIRPQNRPTEAQLTIRGIDGVKRPLSDYPILK